MSNKPVLVNTLPSERLQRIAGAVCNNNWSDVARYTEYLSQEFIELIEAFNSRDELGYRDALADMRVLMDALAAVTEIPIEEDYREVLDKLKTRFDNTLADVNITKQKYAEIGIETTHVYDKESQVFAVVVTESAIGADGENYPRGKFLKSHKFQQPDLKPLVKPLVNDTTHIFTELRNKNTILHLQKVTA